MAATRQHKCAQTFASFFAYLILSAHPLEAVRKYKAFSDAKAEVSDSHAVMQELTVALSDLDSGRMDLETNSSNGERMFHTCERTENNFFRMTQKLLDTMNEYKKPSGGLKMNLGKRVSASILLKAFKIARAYGKASEAKCAWVSEPSTKNGALDSILDLNREINPCADKAVEALRAAPGDKEGLAATLSMMVEGMQGKACTGEEPRTARGANISFQNADAKADLPDEETVDSLANIANESSSLIALSQSTTLPEFPSYDIAASMGFGAVVLLAVVIQCVVTVTVVGFIVGLIWCIVKAAMSLVVNLFKKRPEDVLLKTDFCLQMLWRRIGLLEDPTEKGRYWQYCDMRY
jgi:hypothetical protein